MNRTTANLLLLLAGAIWGMGFIAQRTAMDDIGPMLFIGCRFLMAGLAVAPLAYFELSKQKAALTPARMRQFALLGLVFFLGMSLQQVGLQWTTVTNAGFLTTLYVVMVPAILLFVWREPQPRLVWIASGLSVLGVYLLSSGCLESIAWGDGLIVCCAFVWAVHVILVGFYGRQCAIPVTMACSQFLACSLLGFLAHALAVALGISDSGLTRANLMAALPEILYAGVISGGVAFTLQAIAQRHTHASLAAILMASESLFAALLGAWLLGERLLGVGYVGCCLILVSITAVELVDLRRKGTPG